MTERVRIFPIGSRVVVSAYSRSEGTDNECHGRAGTVIAHGMWTSVQLDKAPRYWKNPVLLNHHNLRAAVGEQPCAAKLDTEEG